jgi:hypothetical protein
MYYGEWNLVRNYLGTLGMLYRFIKGNKLECEIISCVMATFFGFIG